MDGYDWTRVDNKRATQPRLPRLDNHHYNHTHDTRSKNSSNHKITTPQLPLQLKPHKKHKERTQNEEMNCTRKWEESGAKQIKSKRPFVNGRSSWYTGCNYQERGVDWCSPGPQACVPINMNKHPYWLLTVTWLLNLLISIMFLDGHWLLTTIEHYYSIKVSQKLYIIIPVTTTITTITIEKYCNVYNYPSHWNDMMILVCWPCWASQHASNGEAPRDLWTTSGFFPSISLRVTWNWG